MPVDVNDKHVNLGDRVLSELVNRATTGQVFKVKSTAVKEKSLVIISILQVRIIIYEPASFAPPHFFFFFLYCIFIVSTTIERLSLTGII